MKRRQKKREGICLAAVIVVVVFWVVPPSVLACLVMVLYTSPFAYVSIAERRGVSPAAAFFRIRALARRRRQLFYLVADGWECVITNARLKHTHTPARNVRDVVKNLEPLARPWWACKREGKKYIEPILPFSSFFFPKDFVALYVKDGEMAVVVISRQNGPILFIGKHHQPFQLF